VGQGCIIEEVNGKERYKRWILVTVGLKLKERHSFVVGDTSHSQMIKIHLEWDNLTEEMEEGGYAPDTCWVLHNVDEEKKKQLLCCHSEKLVTVLRLISTPPDTVLHI
jgi:hypothetical protein